MRRSSGTIWSKESRGGIEAAAIQGGGSNEPIGVLQTSGIGSVALGTNGAAPTFESVVNLLREVLVANAGNEKLGYLMNTAIAGKLLQTPKIATYDASMVLEELDNFLGFPVALSNHVPSNLTKGSGTNLSAVLFGNWSDLIIAEWGVVDLLIDPYSNSATGAVRVVAFMDCDVAVRHADSFAAIQDAITT